MSTPISTQTSPPSTDTPVPAPTIPPTAVPTAIGGGGGKIRPVGVIVFSPTGVELKALPDKPGLLDKLFDKLPGFIEKIQAIMDPPAEPKAPAA